MSRNANLNNYSNNTSFAGLSNSPKKSTSSPDVENVLMHSSHTKLILIHKNALGFMQTIEIQLQFGMLGSVKNQLSQNIFKLTKSSLSLCEIFASIAPTDWGVQASIALSFIKLHRAFHSELNWSRFDYPFGWAPVRHSNIHVKMQKCVVAPPSLSLSLSNTIELANVQMICNFNKIFERDRRGKFEIWFDIICSLSMSVLIKHSL